MKYVIIVLSFLYVNLSMAKEVTMPNGAECAPGWTCVPPGAKHKHHAPKKATPPVAKAEEPEKSAEEPKAAPAPEVKESAPAEEAKKNRLSLLGGYGARGGLNAFSPTASSLTVQDQWGLVGGLQYQRQLYKDLSVGIQGQTNKTGSLLLGLDF